MLSGNTYCWSDVFGIFLDSAERDNSNNFSGTFDCSKDWIQSKIFFVDFMCYYVTRDKFCSYRIVNLS